MIAFNRPCSLVVKHAEPASLLKPVAQIGQAKIHLIHFIRLASKQMPFSGYIRKRKQLVYHGQDLINKGLYLVTLLFFFDWDFRTFFGSRALIFTNSIRTYTLILNKY